jgi:nuclear pore complex protein Nup93
MIWQLTLQLQDSWKLLASITGESEIRDGNPFGGPRERQFTKDYILNASSDSTEAAKVRKSVQKGARRFLEKQYVLLGSVKSPILIITQVPRNR